MLHLRSRLLPLLRAATHPTAAASSSSLHLRSLLLSTSASASASQTPFCIDEYLVATCGLSDAQALKASKKLPHLKSTSNPDAVLALLSGVGLSRPDIAAVVAADPLFLRARADNIARRLASLRDRVGLSDPQIARFLLVGGAMSLRSCDVAPRMEFWIPFFGSFDKLLQAVRRNNRILKADLEKVVKPNITLLGECGLSVCDMAKLSARSRLLVCNPERVKAFVLRADKLGVPRTSYAFKYAVDIACCITEDKVAAKLEFLRSTLGCSMEKICAAVCMAPNILGRSEERLRCKIEFLRSTLGCSMEKICVAVCMAPNILGLSEERLRCKIEFLRSTLGCSMEKFCVAVCMAPNILELSEERLRCKIEFLRSTLGCSMDKLSVAVCKSAQILGLSEENLRRKIEFMVTEVGLETEYIVERPGLLTFSLEKRLVPRHYVVKILQAKGLMKKGATEVGLYKIFYYADKDFIAKYIDRHKDDVPGLADVYTAVCAGKVPAEIQL